MVPLLGLGLVVPEPKNLVSCDRAALSHSRFAARHPMGWLNCKQPVCLKTQMQKKVTVVAVAGLALGDVGRVGTPMSHHERLPAPSPAMRAENPAWEGGRWKLGKCGASQHGWVPHPAVALGDALEDALAIHPLIPPLWVTNWGAD